MVEALSLVAAAATLAQIGLLIALHVLPTGYRPTRDALSDYGIGRYRGLFWAQTATGAAARLALAGALADSHPPNPGVVSVLLILSGAALLIMPLFPTDQGSSRFQTPRGTIHMALAIAAFATVTVAASELAGRLENQIQWAGVKSLIIILPWVMTGTVIAVAVATVSPRLKPIFGLIERLFSVSSIAWFLVVSIELARIAS